MSALLLPTNKGVSERMLALPWPAVDGSNPAEPASSFTASHALDGLMDAAARPTIAVALCAARETLGMEVAYISELMGEHFLVREMDGDAPSFGLAGELALPGAQTFCERMLKGRIPSLISDVRVDDRTMSVPLARSGNVGAVATVRLTLSDGRLWGTLCALSHGPKAFDGRDLQFLGVLARLISDRIELGQTTAELRRLAARLDVPEEATMMLTRDGVVTGWNEANEQRFGYSASEAVGRNVVDLLAPNGGAELQGAMGAAAAGRGSGRPT